MMYQLRKRSVSLRTKIFRNLAGRCGSVVVRERVVSLAAVFNVVTQRSSRDDTKN